MINHLLSIQRQTGRTPQALLDAPSCPEGCEQLWRDFLTLSGCRGQGMAGPLRITFTDIDAWQRVTGVRIEPWEVEALRRADSAFMADQAGRRAK